METLRGYKSKDGELMIYKVIGNRKMAESEVKDLLTLGQIGPLDGFRSKKGKPFSAVLKYNKEEKKAEFVFDGQRDASGAIKIDFTGLPEGVPHIVSYDAKWTSGSVDDLGTVPVMHPSLPNAVAARVRRVAADAFRAVGVRDYGRVDVRLAASGIPYVVDVNPNCDLSPHAGMARAAAAVGIDYDDLAGLLVRYALRRRRSGEGVAMEQRSRQPVPARSGATRRL